MIDYGEYIRMRTTMGNLFSNAEGYPCPLINSDGKHLLNYGIYGNSTQKGTPSPSSPEEIISVGDPVTDEADANYGKYKIPVIVYGKNFLNCTFAGDVYPNKTIINDDFSITVNKGTNTSANPINIRQSKAYTIPADNITITASCKNANTTVKMIVRTKVYNSSTSDYYTITSSPKSFTLSKGDSIQAYLQMSAGAVLSETITLYPQFETGKTATDFEPYINPVITDIYLDEPLRKIGDYADYIDFKKQVVVRKIKKYTLSANETWNSWSANGNGRRLMIYQTTDKLYGDNITTLGYFNAGTVSQKLSSSKTNILCGYHLSSACYWYPDYTVMGLDGTEDIATANTALQEWLKSAGDIYFTYVLKKPKETKISLPVVASKKGDVFIATNTSLPASNISARYSTKP